MVRVGCQRRQPAGVQGILLLDTRSRRDVLAQQQLRARCPHVQVAGTAQAQAQVDVQPPLQRGGFVETAHLQEQPLVHQQALAAHRRIVLIHLQTLQVAWGVQRHAGKCLAYRPVEPKHIAGMTDGGITGHQFGTDHADFLTHAVVEQLLQPVAVQHGRAFVEP